MSIIASIAVGTAAGLGAAPHCLLMCGPVAGTCARSGGELGVYTSMRLLCYVALGALVCSIAAPLAHLLPPPITSLVLGVAMGASLLYTARSVARVRPRGDGPDVSVAQVLRRRAPRARDLGLAATLGLGTGLLPCGALHAALLVAIGTGTVLGGTIAMAAFGLTSGVALLGASALTRRMAIASSTSRHALAALLVVGAVVLIARPALSLMYDDPVCHG